MTFAFLSFNTGCTAGIDKIVDAVRPIKVPEFSVACKPT